MLRAPQQRFSPRSAAASTAAVTAAAVGKDGGAPRLAQRRQLRARAEVSPRMQVRSFTSAAGLTTFVETCPPTAGGSGGGGGGGGSSAKSKSKSGKTSSKSNSSSSSRGWNANTRDTSAVRSKISRPAVSLHARELPASERWRRQSAGNSGSRGGGADGGGGGGGSRSHEKPWLVGSVLEGRLTADNADNADGAGGADSATSSRLRKLSALREERQQQQLLQGDEHHQKDEEEAQSAPEQDETPEQQRAEEDQRPRIMQPLPADAALEEQLESYYRSLGEMQVRMCFSCDPLL